VKQTPLQLQGTIVRENLEFKSKNKDCASCNRSRSDKSERERKVRTPQDSAPRESGGVPSESLEQRIVSQKIYRPVFDGIRVKRRR